VYGFKLPILSHQVNSISDNLEICELLRITAVMRTYPNLNLPCDHPLLNPDHPVGCECGPGPGCSRECTAASCADTCALTTPECTADPFHLPKGAWRSCAAVYTLTPRDGLNLRYSLRGGGKTTMSRPYSPDRIRIGATAIRLLCSIRK
jgi:hypothetical protein